MQKVVNKPHEPKQTPDYSIGWLEAQLMIDVK